MKLYYKNSTFLLLGCFGISSLQNAILGSTWLNFCFKKPQKSRLVGVLGRLGHVLGRLGSFLGRLRVVLDSYRAVLGRLGSRLVGTPRPSRLARGARRRLLGCPAKSAPSPGSYLYLRDIYFLKKKIYFIFIYIYIYIYI